MRRSMPKANADCWPSSPPNKDSSSCPCKLEIGVALLPSLNLSYISLSQCRKHKSQTSRFMGRGDQRLTHRPSCKQKGPPLPGPLLPRREEREKNPARQTQTDIPVCATSPL